MDLPSTSSKKMASASAGAADQELFIKEFEEIPRRQFVLLNSIEDNLATVKFVLENSNLDWQKRVDAMQTFRSVLIDLKDVNLISNSLKDLENSFQNSLKDLRSKVVREACITIAYTSVRLQNKCEKFIEVLLPLLFNLTQNSAKIMSTSACVAIRFIIQNTHSGKFLPIIHQNLSSKSKDIRRFCCDFLNQLLRTWSRSLLERHTPMIIEDIKKGLNDADPEARVFSRKAFWIFEYHFKDKANHLFLTLDANKRRLLENEKTADINRGQVDCMDSAKLNVVNKKSRIVAPPTKRFVRPKNPALTPQNMILSPVRAVSSIDIDAIKRAKMRSEERHAALRTTMQCANSNSSIKENLNTENTKTPLTNKQPPKKVSTSSIPKMALLNVASNQTRNSVKTSPLNRVTRSQPGSRSNSPSVRSAYLNDLTSPFSSDLSSCSNGKNRRSAIPVITTRQPSQDDYTNSPLMTRSFMRRDSLSSSKKMNHTSSMLDYRSDQSEVSSLCSDKSFGDRKLEDINDILKNLNSTHWPNKKDGLFNLEHFIYHSPVELNEDQLFFLTDIFTKMLLDPNTKALSHVLNVLNILIIHYHERLNFWLYILLTRLFLKTGSDLLSSVQKRMIKTFETIGDTFCKLSQFNVLIQFISDNKLTPVLKVKITSLQYLLNLILQMDPSDLNCKALNKNKEFEQFLIKIITWTEDPKSAQLRSLSQDIILELFNLNTPEFCSIVGQLPNGYWNTAYKYMKEKKVSKKNVEDSVVFSQSFYDQMLKSSFNQSEVNQTAIFDSLRKATEEIDQFTSYLRNDDLVDNLPTNHQEVTFNNIHNDLNSFTVNQKNSNHKTNRQLNTTAQSSKYSCENDDLSTYKTSEIGEISEKKTNSMDSGISQIDCVSTSCKTSTSSSTKMSPESRSENVDHSCASDLTTYNSFKSMNSFYVTTASSMMRNDDEDEKDAQDQIVHEINNNQYDKCTRNSLEDSNKTTVSEFDVRNFEQLLRNVSDCTLHIDDRLKSLEKLDTIFLTNDLKTSLRPLMNIDLIELFLARFDEKELILRQLAIKTFSDLINEFASECFEHQHLKLILDKLFSLSKQDHKDMNLVIQHLTDAITVNFHIRTCVDYLVTKIDSAQYPANEVAIKLMTKFIKHSNEEIVNKLVPKLIPSIVRSNDNAITSVRKFSIFCLVELFDKVGLVIKPYLSSLDSSKIKLLKIYIDDSKTTRSSSPLLEK